MKHFLGVIGVSLLISGRSFASLPELDIRLDAFDPHSGRYSITIINNSVRNGVFVEMESLKSGSFSLKMPNKSTGRGGGVDVHPVERAYCRLDVKNPKYPTHNAKTLDGVLKDFPNQNNEWKSANMELSFTIHGVIEGNGESFIVSRYFQFPLGELKLPLLGTGIPPAASGGANRQPPSGSSGPVPNAKPNDPACAPAHEPATDKPGQPSPQVPVPPPKPQAP